MEWLALALVFSGMIINSRLDTGRLRPNKVKFIVENIGGWIWIAGIVMCVAVFGWLKAAGILLGSFLLGAILSPRLKAVRKSAKLHQ